MSRKARTLRSRDRAAEGMHAGRGFEAKCVILLVRNAMEDLGNAQGT